MPSTPNNYSQSDTYISSSTSQPSISSLLSYTCSSIISSFYPFLSCLTLPMLAPVIPLLIKLLLCSSLSSKVECALEIASLISLEDSVNSAIYSLCLSSLSMSQ